jgi:hypothetical protein
LISGFRRDVVEICALLGYYAASARISKMYFDSLFNLTQVRVGEEAGEA